MKRRLPVVECDICGYQQVDNGDPTEVLGITIHAAFFAGPGGGGRVPKGSFVCHHCLYGNDFHGPALLNVLVSMIFFEEQYSEALALDAYALRAQEISDLRQDSSDLKLLRLKDKLTTDQP